MSLQGCKTKLILPKTSQLSATHMSVYPRHTIAHINNKNRAKLALSRSPQLYASLEKRYRFHIHSKSLKLEGEDIFKLAPGYELFSTRSQKNCRPQKDEFQQTTPILSRGIGSIEILVSFRRNAQLAQHPKTLVLQSYLLTISSAGLSEKRKT